MRTLFIVILLCTIFSRTFAGENNKNTQFRSFINGISCGQIIEDLDREETRKAYELMVGSFITGSNYAKNRDSKTDLNGMLLITEQFCRQNPKQHFLSAVISLDKSIDNRDHTGK